MSTIVTFLIVGGILAVAAAFAISEADNGATAGGQSRRDPGDPTIGDRLRRTGRAIGVWALAAGALVARRLRAAGRAIGVWALAAGALVARRLRRLRPDKSTRSRDSDPPPGSTPSDRPGRLEGAPQLRSIPQPEAEALEPVPAPAGAVLVGDTVGEPVSRATPSIGRRLQSFVGLILLIVLLGLALAAVLGALIAVGGRSLDNFVN